MTGINVMQLPVPIQDSKKHRGVAADLGMFAEETIDEIEYTRGIIANGHAEKSALEAERLDTRHQYPRVNYLLGLVAIQHKDYEGASKRFKAYLKLDPQADDATTVKSQIDAIDKVTASAPVK